MNAGQLKELLKDVPDDRQVVMSQDPEGNGFYDLHDVDLFGIIRRFGYEIETVHPDDIDEDDDSYQPAVVLWP